GAVKLTPSRRLRLIAERGGCCEICGATGQERQLQVHHRLPVLRGGDDSDENLLVLCFACHHHLQPCARGCGHWTKKPNTVCRHCWTQERLNELYVENRRSTREPIEVSTS
ncbi:MAG TPA: HNH endonuclease signature motif containing protein, partial [Candidatus Dormibacteraeota bacterium]|nr:HNH endonuclease signature motif containing protein [Candidatus Dormibacteraeota bacterium]